MVFLIASEPLAQVHHHRGRVFSLLWFQWSVGVASVLLYIACLSQPKA